MVSCDRCHKKLSSQESLNYHMKAIHLQKEGTNDKILEYNGMFRTFGDLQVNGSSTECNFCKKPYSSKFNLNRHIKKHHQSSMQSNYNDDFKCTKCKNLTHLSEI